MFALCVARDAVLAGSCGLGFRMCGYCAPVEGVVAGDAVWCFL